MKLFSIKKQNLGEGFTMGCSAGIFEFPQVSLKELIAAEMLVSGSTVFDALSELCFSLCGKGDEVSVEIAKLAIPCASSPEPVVIVL